MRFEKVNFGRHGALWKYIYSKFQKYILRQEPYGCSTSASSQEREARLKVRLKFVFWGEVRAWDGGNSDERGLKWGGGVGGHQRIFLKTS